MGKATKDEIERLSRAVREEVWAGLCVARDALLEDFDALEPHERIPAVKAVEFLERLIEQAAGPEEHKF